MRANLIFSLIISSVSPSEWYQCLLGRQPRGTRNNDKVKVLLVGLMRLWLSNPWSWVDVIILCKAGIESGCHQRIMTLQINLERISCFLVCFEKCWVGLHRNKKERK
ncbi:hypothetical protein CEXT_559631 [Caerostris extrusa]|uniref:Uncharacterized protein n=1 Tax=Caerostris extrusa TaxID=172846 RepID=A0AAV4P788_CAEEX|nr:hypothetical protein CEXT_559631 [Caerostris extrusa]